MVSSDRLRICGYGSVITKTSDLIYFSHNMTEDDQTGLVRWNPQGSEESEEQDDTVIIYSVGRRFADRRWSKPGQRPRSGKAERRRDEQRTRIDASTIGSSLSTNSLEYEGRSSSGLLLQVQHRAIEGMLVQRFTGPVTQGSCAVARVSYGCAAGVSFPRDSTQKVGHLMRPDLRNILIASEGGGESAGRFGSTPGLPRVECRAVIADRSPRRPPCSPEAELGLVRRRVAQPGAGQGRLRCRGPPQASGFAGSTDDQWSRLRGHENRRLDLLRGLRLRESRFRGATRRSRESGSPGQARLKRVWRGDCDLLGGPSLWRPARACTGQAAATAPAGTTTFPTSARGTTSVQSALRRRLRCRRVDGK